MSRTGERIEEDGDICTSTLIFAKGKNYDITLVRELPDLPGPNKKCFRILEVFLFSFERGLTQFKVYVVFSVFQCDY